jgi:hypothetical protein
MDETTKIIWQGKERTCEILNTDYYPLMRIRILLDNDESIERYMWKWSIIEPSKTTEGDISAESKPSKDKSQGDADRDNNSDNRSTESGKDDQGERVERKRTRGRTINRRGSGK